MGARRPSVSGWSAAGYLKSAHRPFAGFFHSLASSGMAGWIDLPVPIALVLIGLSLVLGLFTQLAASAPRDF